MARAVLETERLTLSEWDDAAFADFARLTNTPAVMRWLGPVMDEAGLVRMRTRLDGFAAQFGHTFWACRRRDDGGHLSGEVLGMVGLKRGDAEEAEVAGMLEIGWRLREDAWGHGYAGEAARACLAHGFASFEDDKIVALTVDQNVASWRLMERLGMIRRPEWDHHDPRYSDELNPTIVYAISRESFS